MSLSPEQLALRWADCPSLSPEVNPPENRREGFTLLVLPPPTSSDKLLRYVSIRHLANFSSKVMLHLLPLGNVKNFMMGSIISSVMSLLILAPRSSRKKRAVASRSSILASGMPMQLREPMPKG